MAIPTTISGAANLAGGVVDAAQLVAGLATLSSRVRAALLDGGTNLSTVNLIELDPRKGDTPTAAASLQYFPETISDSKAINYQSKEIPGGSLPLYQWVSSGERSISFETVFTSDIDLVTSSSSGGSFQDEVVRGANITDLSARLKTLGLEGRNVDARTAVVWLRRFMLPTYVTTDTAPLTYAPRKLLLHIPNSGIGLAGGDSGGSTLHPDSVCCVMNECAVNYQAFFPSGFPRIVTVSLGFHQVAQRGGLVRFPQVSFELDQVVEGQGGKVFRYPSRRLLENPEGNEGLGYSGPLDKTRDLLERVFGLQR